MPNEETKPLQEPVKQISTPSQPAEQLIASGEQQAPKKEVPVATKELTNQKASSFFEKWKSLSPVKKELGLFVILPTLLVGLYCGLIASPMYVSEAKFAVRSTTEQPQGLDFASQFLKTANSAVQDAQIVEAYIRSPDIFDKLDRKLKVIDHYSSSQWDWISRLATSPTLWDKQVFWNFVSKPIVNPDNGIVTYTVRAYEPEMAQAISKEVLQQSEALVNEMNDRARQDTVALAENEVKIAQARIAKAQKALEDFRNTHAELDPQATATGLQSIVFELEGERAKLLAQIKDAQSFMKNGAPQLTALRSRLTAVEKQLSAEKARLVGSTNGDVLNSWVSEYETLMIESEFAKKQLTTAMTAMETARIALMSKTKYVVLIEQPTLPDESRYPRTWIFTFCAFLSLLLIYGLARLVVASIREHAGF